MKSAFDFLPQPAHVFFGINGTHRMQRMTDGQGNIVVERGLWALYATFKGFQEKICKGKGLANLVILVESGDCRGKAPFFCRQSLVVFRDKTGGGGKGQLGMFWNTPRYQG